MTLRITPLSTKKSFYKIFEFDIHNLTSLSKQKTKTNKVINQTHFNTKNLIYQKILETNHEKRGLKQSNL